MQFSNKVSIINLINKFTKRPGHPSVLFLAGVRECTNTDRVRQEPLYMKVKVKDIAAQAGVSTTAVSLVLNHKPCRIAEDTKEKIFQVAAELEYQQKNYGIFQGFKKVKTLGLIIPEIDNPFFAQLAEQISYYAAQSGYTVFQCNVGEDFASFKNAVECLIAKTCDGVLLTAPQSITPEGIKLVKYLQNSRIPMVLLDRAVYSVFCDFVTCDNKRGGRLAAEYLISHGHTHVGVLLGGENTYTARTRLEGFWSAFAANHLPLDQVLTYQGTFSRQTGYAGAKTLYEQGIRAFFAENDQIAEGVYEFAREMELTIGKEISVIGYDDTRFSRILVPKLTTIGQDIGGMAEKAVELAIEKIEFKENGTNKKSSSGTAPGTRIPGQNYYFPPELREGESVAAITPDIG